MWVPTTMGHNLQHLCPEIARNMPLEVLDCCSHDIWGAGCLMLRAFTATSPWAIPLVANCDTNHASLSKLHEVWVRLFHLFLYLCTTKISIDTHEFCE